MKVTAAGSRGADLPEEAIGRTPGYKHSVFHVTVGEEYNVYAMALWVGGLILMVLDDLGRPHWYPLELFRVSESSVPAAWRFGYIQERVGTMAPIALWGYRSLIDDPRHHEALIDRNRGALRVFLDECDRADLSVWELRKLEGLESIFSN